MTIICSGTKFYYVYLLCKLNTLYLLTLTYRKINIMFLLFGAFIAGLLTVLAPCVLPLLPIIIGGSIGGDTKDRRRPIIIVVSLAISLIVFTLLLKVSTLFINISPELITQVSGGIIVILGLLTIFPTLYARIIAKLGIEQKSQKLLGKGFTNKSKFTGPIITGAALGPVFSSCSPVYAYILATILPVSFAEAMSYITAYVVGLAAILLVIGYYGQRAIGKVKFASNPKGWFQRTLGVIFILTGLLIFSGNAKTFQTYISTNTPFNFDGLSAKLIPGGQDIDKNKLFNVKPYEAPEFAGLEKWINSDPQTLKSLKGKVVLVDFWTYSCINCIRNNPYLVKDYEAYKDKGFVVIGMHAPEFAFEKKIENVQKAVTDQKITYPVALDNDFSTWNAYNNQYWPSYYLIDAEGKVRRIHYGEGQYKETEQAIRALLEEKGEKLDKGMVTSSDKVASSSKQTEETYLGTKRAGNFGSTPAIALGKKPGGVEFTPNADLKQNFWSLSGKWETTPELITARGNSKLQFRVAAKDVYLVAGSNLGAQNIKVTLNGKPVNMTDSAGSDVKNSQITVTTSKLYRVLSFPKFTPDAMLELEVPDGVDLNVFTFGS